MSNDHIFTSEYLWHNHMVKGLGGLDTTVTDQTRYSFWLQTGICPEQQVEIENYFDQSLWGGDKRQLIDISLFK